MKSRKAQIQAKYHKIPTIRFEDQRLTSFSGLLIFQALFMSMHMKQRLKTTPEQVFQSLKDIAYFWASSCSIATYCSSSAWVPSVTRGGLLT